MAGQAAAYDELRARRCLWSPLRLTRLCREHVSVFVASPATSLFVSIECGGRSKMRFIGIDVHRDFCEMCVLAGDSGEEQRRRVATRPAELEAFARELDRSDVVALETSSPATAVARVLEPYAGRVMVIDARTLARLPKPAREGRTDWRTASTIPAIAMFVPVSKIARGVVRPGSMMLDEALAYALEQLSSAPG